MYTHTFAMSVSLVPNKATVSIGEEFYVDLIFNTENKNINGIETTLTYDSETVLFVRAENGQSFITHWIVSPIITSPGSISLSGITPNGFSGFLNSSEIYDRTGNISRLVFSPKKSGQSVIVVNRTLVTENDGEGTPATINPAQVVISIGVDIINSEYKLIDIHKPILSAEIVKDQNLYNGQMTLVFNAIDKDSGIEGIYIKKNKEWIRITNPYTLEAKTSRGILTVKAVDFSGNTATERFFLPGYGSFWFYIILATVVLGVLIGFRFLYKSYGKNKFKKII